MNNQIKVSIITTTFNNSPFIKKAIQSVLAQTFADFELIILDDGPGYDTTELVKEFEKDKRTIYLRNEPPLGLFESANEGIRRARGEYIARIDDDDTWADVDKLRKQVEFLDTHPEYVLVGTGLIGVDEDGTELYRNLVPEWDDEIRETMLEKNCIVHSSVMYRKSAVVEVGCYKEAKRPYSEDYDLWLKLGTRGKLANLPIYGTALTARNRGTAFTFRERLITSIKDARLSGQFRDEYPHYWRARGIRSVRILDYSLRILSEVPPFIYLKRFLKNKFPTLWRVITKVSGGVFQGMRGVIRLFTSKVTK